MAVVVLSTVCFYALTRQGIASPLAFAAVVLAVPVGWLVVQVPRRMVLENDVDHLSPEDQETFYREAYNARLQEMNAGGGD